MSDGNEIKFFLGSNTKRGFVPLFEELRDPKLGNRFYILKGGPGSGKSTLMKRVAKTLKEQGHLIEYIHCASDPNSLDAFIDHDAGAAMMDGTAPHILDPKYPGAYDILIHMGDAWDRNKLLKNRSKIIELSDMISRCHLMATSCITAAAALLEGNREMAKPYVNQNAIRNILKELIGVLQDTKTGKERKRLLSAVSVGETVFYSDTIDSLCPKQYVIEDEWGAASKALINTLHEAAINMDLEMITCYCSIRTPDKIDHLLFPSAKIAITTANTFHSVDRQDSIRFHGLMKPVMQEELAAMTKNQVMAKELIYAAGEHVKRAKQLHDDLEAFYVEAMDFSRLDGIYEQILEDILNQKKDIKPY